MDIVQYERAVPCNFTSWSCSIYIHQIIYIYSHYVVVIFSRSCPLVTYEWGSIVRAAKGVLPVSVVNCHLSGIAS